MPFLLAFGVTDKHVQVVVSSNGAISELSALDSIFGYMAHPISLAVNQAGRKATLLGWRLGRCTLQWLPGQCTIIMAVSQAGQPEPLGLGVRRCLRALEVSWCSQVQWGLPMKGSSTGGTSPSQGTWPVCAEEGPRPRRSIHWSGSHPVRKPRVTWNLLINRGFTGIRSS